ncbi:heterokaryon incompatibility protein-domain-containing protein [Hyaloscypha sp. PMI_1271]|nr:heterokaryon incompatibility protein-domain-containing protein [Hyaloscypha sp. PMI_1271]
MRLLNIETMRMEEFFDETVASYAILSHRWGQEEVSLQEWNRRKAGYSKIVSCVEMARNQKISRGEEVHSCSFVWIDTCCIDKTNSAELSEAINSMFRWYRNAMVCLVYLVDIPTNLGPDEMESKVRKSNWFERGWTLQELLAPQSVKFFNRCWEFLFDKTEKSDLIKEITRVDVRVLRDRDILDVTCTAKKMSWAASRTTTRKEDLAYCLLGIFDVNMPLLYGEGDKAFVRLQEEIIRQSGDPSIFAWGYNSSEDNATSGIFAPSPACFIGCYNIIDYGEGVGPSRAVITMNNITLSVKLSYLRPKTDRLSFIYAYLCCSDDPENLIVLPLVTNLDGGHSQFGSDVESTMSVWFERRAGTRPIVIGDRLVIETEIWMHESRTISVLKKEHGERFQYSDVIYLNGVNHPSSKAVVEEIYPPHFWGKRAKTLEFDSNYRCTWYPGAIELETGFYPSAKPECEYVAYIRISHRNHKRGEMVLIVRQLGSARERDIEVRVANWTICGYESLADIAQHGRLNNQYEDSSEVIGSGVKRIEFCGFMVDYSRPTITISDYPSSESSGS